jgi:hypothetical protein
LIVISVRDVHMLIHSTASVPNARTFCVHPTASYVYIGKSGSNPLHVRLSTKSF